MYWKAMADGTSQKVSLDHEWIVSVEHVLKFHRDLRWAKPVLEAFCAASDQSLPKRLAPLTHYGVSRAVLFASMRSSSGDKYGIVAAIMEATAVVDQTRSDEAAASDSQPGASDADQRKRSRVV
jgi:hypothetical protein